METIARRATPAGARVESGPRDRGRPPRATRLISNHNTGSRWKLKVDPAAPHVVTVHLDLGCWKELEALGARGVLDSLYAGMVTQADAGYKVAVTVDCDACAGPRGNPSSREVVGRGFLDQSSRET